MLVSLLNPQESSRKGAFVIVIFFGFRLRLGNTKASSAFLCKTHKNYMPHSKNIGGGDANCRFLKFLTKTVTDHVFT